MAKIQKNQSGFSVVELLLALIFVAIIAFIGVYVAHNHRSKTASTTTASSVTIKKTPVSTATTSPVTTATPTPTQGYLTVTQWGIKLPVSGALANAQYTDVSSAYSSTYPTMEVTVSDALATDTCKGGIVGWITRVPDSVQGATEVYYSHIGTYNYIYERGQDCTASSSLIDQFKQAVATMVAI
ncbi:MAG: hypothetical protein JWO47_210 [Candidatus Saccharibacteria bacterium]|nr:hypothetical protein [Candidatus Saccharibacteria bacterium]